METMNKRTLEFLVEVFEELEKSAMLHATVKRVDIDRYTVTFNGKVCFLPGVWVATQNVNDQLTNRGFKITDIRYTCNSVGEQITVFSVE